MSESGGPRRVLLATNNPHKFVEVTDILGAGFEVVAQDPDAWETGSTFEANALVKAVAVRDATGQLTVADDSGIEIDALGGMPGVYSSRWTNEEDWIGKVLRSLEGIPMPQRTCRYVCAAAAAFPDGTEAVVRGVVEGYVAEEPRGEHGFGYDPIMIPTDGDGRTFGQMEASAKHAISHRARAFTALAAILVSGQGGGDGPVGGGVGGDQPEEPVAVSSSPPEASLVGVAVGGDQPDQPAPPVDPEYWLPPAAPEEPVAE